MTTLSQDYFCPDAAYEPPHITGLEVRPHPALQKNLEEPM